MPQLRRGRGAALPMEPPLIPEAIESVLRCPPINLIYLHYHNAIRSELDRLSKSVNELERADAALGKSLAALKSQYRFLEKVYRYHSSVEDEVQLHLGPSCPC